MADAVASQTILDGPNKVVMKFTNVSDGTGESAVTKVDVSGLSAGTDGATCTGVAIEQIWWQCTGMKVSILFDATSDVLAIQLGENQSGYHDYRSFGGLTNNAGSGKTGDINFTTVGDDNNDTYVIILAMRKNYGWSMSKEIITGLVVTCSFGALAWMVSTLISVDKRTEVMAVQVSANHDMLKPLWEDFIKRSNVQVSSLEEKWIG